jgi:hypothetical protein
MPSRRRQRGRAGSRTRAAARTRSASRTRARAGSRSRRSAARPPRRRFAWAAWSDERLLDLRLSDLGVRIEGTWLEGCVERLYEELERRGVRVRPHVWLSHEWFSPHGVPGFAIPFYLTHPRLMRLERSQMLEVEGGTVEECMRILRHEAGHALQHAYGLQRRRAWQRVFGRSSKRYPDFYKPNRASRRYVQHLRLYYAQSHPVEDFAETFAVWLGARALWRKRYATWPALRKLEYVDDLVEELRDATPPVRTRAQVDPIHSLRMTLGEHYEEKRKHYLAPLPDIYDRDLLELFSDDPRHAARPRASTFIRRNRAEIRELVARWTGEYQFTLEHVLTEMIRRCRELRLRAVGNERRLRLDFAVLLTVKTIQSLYTRPNWIPL